MLDPHQSLQGTCSGFQFPLGALGCLINLEKEVGLHGREEHCPFLGLDEATELTSPDCSLLAEAQYGLLLAMCSVGETMLHSRN